jgi:hypothetical protein
VASCQPAVQTVQDDDGRAGDRGERGRRDRAGFDRERRDECRRHRARQRDRIRRPEGGVRMPTWQVPQDRVRATQRDRQRRGQVQRAEFEQRLQRASGERGRGQRRADVSPRARPQRRRLASSGCTRHHPGSCTVLRFATMSDAHAFWVTAPGRGEIRAVRLPAARDGDAVVRALYSGISRGTESLVYTGRVPPSEYARMRAPFQEGEFPGPVKYGYANVGVVEHGPAELVGRAVFCLYPHQTRYVVPVGALHVVPDGVPPARAVLAANLETAINGLWDGTPRVGDRIAVVGGGVVGCLVAWLAARIAGCRVQLVDVNPARARVAAALGVPFARPGTPPATSISSSTRAVRRTVS